MADDQKPERKSLIGLDYLDAEKLRPAFDVVQHRRGDPIDLGAQPCEANGRARSTERIHSTAVRMLAARRADWWASSSSSA